MSTTKKPPAPARTKSDQGKGNASKSGKPANGKPANGRRSSVVSSSGGKTSGQNNNKSTSSKTTGSTTGVAKKSPPNSGGNVKKKCKVYITPLSPTCRAVWMYILQHNISIELETVDITTIYTDDTESKKELWQLNPLREMPCLVAGEDIVFGGPCVLTYIATNYNKPSAKDLECQNLITWAHSELHRAIGYTYVYPQMFDRFRLSSAGDTEALEEVGIKEMSRYLEVLEKHYLAKNPFVCGAELTAADYYIATIIIQTQWLSFDLKLWPAVMKWIETISTKEFWKTAHAEHVEFMKTL